MTLRWAVVALPLVAAVAHYIAPDVAGESGTLGPLGQLAWGVVYWGVILGLLLAAILLVRRAVRHRAGGWVRDASLAGWAALGLAVFTLGLPARLSHEIDFRRFEPERLRAVNLVASGQLGPVPEIGAPVSPGQNAPFFKKLPADLDHLARGGWLMTARDGDTTFVFFPREKWFRDDAGFLYRTDGARTLPASPLFDFQPNSGMHAARMESRGGGWYWAHWENYD